MSGLEFLVPGRHLSSLCGVWRASPPHGRIGDVLLDVLSGPASVPSVQGEPGGPLTSPLPHPSLCGSAWEGDRVEICVCLSKFLRTFPARLPGVPNALGCSVPAAPPWGQACVLPCPWPCSLAGAESAAWPPDTALGLPLPVKPWRVLAGLCPNQPPRRAPASDK